MFNPATRGDPAPNHHEDEDWCKVRVESTASRNPKLAAPAAPMAVAADMVTPIRAKNANPTGAKPPMMIPITPEQGAPPCLHPESCNNGPARCSRPMRRQAHSQTTPRNNRDLCMIFALGEGIGPRFYWEMMFV